jgi:ATPases involved in chromosome partitioning
MGKIIAFANQKGGVAKTTSTYNIGVSLARKGKNTLMVDLDSQASLTISAGLEPYDFDNTIVNVLKKEGTPFAECVQKLQDNLTICTSRLELAQLEMEMIGRPMRETILKRALEGARAKYDFILIDCPPQLSIMTINALACCDYVVIPVKTDYLAYRGVELLMESISDTKALINPSLSVIGVVATMYEKRVKDDNEILQALQDKYNVIGIIKKLAIAKKGVYDGRSVSEQSPNNDIAIEYDKVSDYIIAEEWKK